MHDYILDISTLGQRAALTPREFGSLFGHSEFWTYRLVCKGTLRVIKPNGRIMIPVGEIKRLNGTAHIHTTRCRREVASEVSL